MERITGEPIGNLSVLKTIFVILLTQHAHDRADITSEREQCPPERPEESRRASTREEITSAIRDRNVAISDSDKLVARARRGYAVEIFVKIQTRTERLGIIVRKYIVYILAWKFIERSSTPSLSSSSTAALYPAAA